MYLVKAIDEAPGYIRDDTSVVWSINDVRMVDDDQISYYQNHPTVFTILAGPTFSVPGSGQVASSFVLANSDSLVEENKLSGHGKISAAYIDFNGAGEAAMSVTINGAVYLEADTAAPATGVWTNGASAADSAASLISAINGDTRATVPFTAVADVSSDGVWVFWDAVGANNITISTTSASNCTVQNSTGGAAVGHHDSLSLSHTVNTQELLSGAVEIPVPFTPTGFHVTAVSSSGAPIYMTDVVTIEADPDRIRIATTGATNLVNTNVVHLTVFN